MKKQYCKWFLLVIISIVFVNLALAGNTMPLDGTWNFRLDPDNVGVNEKWYTQKLEDTVRLPGTTDENHKGIFKDEKEEKRLSRLWYWKGPAWYQKQVTIPQSWAGKKVSLFFERTKNSRLWVDDVFCGWDNSLSAAHIFDVTKAITPGKHTITVVIDNSKLPPVGPSHAVDERTQTNWNGIIGKMQLIATDPVWIEDIQVYPDAAKKEAKVRVQVGNTTGNDFSGQITVECKSYNVDNPDQFKGQTVKVKGSQEKNVVEFIYKPGQTVPLWDEFNPAMLELTLKLDTKAADKQFSDVSSVNFGMRTFTKDRNRFMINGKPVLLRGRLDCANYPLTGYPPMDKAEWKRLINITKDWGLNHWRFHSWCPPKAAFAAADELGVYFQPEFPNKRSGFNAPESKEAAYHNIDRLDVETTETKVSLYDYALRESDLIFKQFGNHPSFAMYTLGNEMGRRKAMFELVEKFKTDDPRHLYAQGSNNMHWNPSLAEGDDFWVTGTVGKKTKPVRASFWMYGFPDPPIETYPPTTFRNFSESIEGVEVPLVGHETGQYQVYPDFRDIPKFTGVTRARNYEMYRDRLTKAGMLDQAFDFVKASGVLAAICYREDIEMALRTPGFGGFQLLDIQDFPGQGTALVGMLNDFYESKGAIEPEKWRQFCSETVPLLGMKKYTWTTDETFIARAQVAHYGPADIEDARVTWTVTGSKGKKIGGGAFDKVTIKQGRVFDVDMFAFDLDKVDVPQKLTITLAIEGTKYRNDYNIWVYPTKVKTNAPWGVMVTDSFQSGKTQKHLAKGGKVLLLPKLDKLPYSVKGGFQCEFWSPMFAESARKSGREEPPGTLGFLCNPEHPVFADFPTDFHTNWQWWHLLKNSRPIKFDDTPEDYRPILQMVDNFVRNSKLGVIAETKVGKGKMLICAIDLLSIQQQPEARQLLHSLLQYAGSRKFAPEKQIDIELLNKLFPK